jgi:hypothetical protein
MIMRELLERSQKYGPGLYLVVWLVTGMYTGNRIVFARASRRPCPDQLDVRAPEEGAHLGVVAQHLCRHRGCSSPATAFHGADHFERTLNHIRRPQRAWLSVRSKRSCRVSCCCRAAPSPMAASMLRNDPRESPLPSSCTHVVTVRTPGGSCTCSPLLCSATAITTHASKIPCRSVA